MSIIKKESNNIPTVFSDLFDYDKFFGGKFFKDFGVELPAANVKETDTAYEIELSVPGFKKEDIQVSLTNDVLTIKADAQTEKNEAGEKYTRKEFSRQTVSRSFQLPQTANTEKIDASYENGILKVDIAKKEEAVKNSSGKTIQVS